MSLEHILLGMVRNSCSGYDLRREFELGAKHYWSAELSQIYPTLKRMESRGWLESCLEPSPKGPDRRVYRRTKAGREVLYEWLQSGPAVGNERLAYIGQLLHMSELNDLDVTLEFLQQLREEFAAVLNVLVQAIGTDASGKPPKDQKLTTEEFHDVISLRMGILSLQAKITWCDESVEAVTKRIKREKRKKKR